MLKKRIIFVLFYHDGYFHLSRNFRLQKVGDCDWLIDKFRFSCIGDYIDELIILDVSRNLSDTDSRKFRESIRMLMKKIFVPLTIGGGIRNISDAHNYFQVGADKVSMNWAISENPELISEVAGKYGSQAVTVSLDAKLGMDGYEAYINNGNDRIGPVSDFIKTSEKIGAGEILITSIDQDGTGAGLDSKLLASLPHVSVPIIACGGAGKPEHFNEILSMPNISGVATGNLFNFIGTGFQELRSELCKSLNNLRLL